MSENDNENVRQTYSDVYWIVCNRFDVVLTHVASQILALFILKEYLNLSETDKVHRKTSMKLVNVYLVNHYLLGTEFSEPGKREPKS